jgi:hypothetical protein
MSGSEEEGTLNTLSSKKRKSTARMSEVMEEAASHDTEEDCKCKRFECFKIVVSIHHRNIKHVSALAYNEQGVI